MCGIREREGGSVSLSNNPQHHHPHPPDESHHPFSGEKEEKILYPVSQQSPTPHTLPDMDFATASEARVILLALLMLLSSSVEAADGSRNNNNLRKRSAELEQKRFLGKDQNRGKHV